MSLDQGLNDLAVGSQRLTYSRLVENEKVNAAQGACSKLLEDVLENPTKSAVTGAAIGLTGAAMVYAARKGHVDCLMPWKKPNVLLIEDTPGMALAFKEALKANGHDVTWVTGIKSLKPLTGITPDGTEIALASRRYKIALVDGDLGKDMLTGPEIVGTLRSQRIMSIGTSTIDNFNVSMLEQGAQIAANKGDLYASLLGNRLDLKAALRAPQFAQDRLRSLSAALKTEELANLREQANARLMHFLLGK